MKEYYTMEGVGACKYTVSFCDGVQTHKDGSSFFGIKIFKSIRAMKKFITTLKTQGYFERGIK